MQLQDLKLILSKLGVPDTSLVPTRPHQLLVPCPLSKWLHEKGTDSNPSCSIRFGDPESPTIFNCFTCSQSGKLWYLAHTVGSLAGDQNLIDIGVRLTTSDEPTLSTRLESIAQNFDDWVFPADETTKVRVLKDHALDTFPKAWDNSKARTYLIGRQVTSVMADFWDLRWHEGSKRVVFPVRTQVGELVGAVGRGIFADVKPKYYNFFGFETGSLLGGLHRSTGQPRWGIVEGFHDVMNVWYWGQQRGYDVVCSFTSHLSDDQAALLAQSDRTTHIMYDQDKAGDKGWTDAQKTLRENYGLRRITWPNTHLDMGAMTEKEFTDALDDIQNFHLDW